jgi:oxygen-independent coproporphyrinogen-3 oxidase
MIAAGFEHYEISNFALPGYHCRHNQVYWQRRTCQAIGCGAHSFIENKWGERRHIPADLNKYKTALLQRKNPAELLETYDHLGAMREFIYLALRTQKGLDPFDFEQRFEENPKKIFSEAFNKTSKYLHLNHNSWGFDLNGWLLYDHLISHFL